MDLDILLKREEAYLEKYAAKSNSKFLSKRRIYEGDDKSPEIRLSYQRDRDRIIHSRAFRRLMHKTQIFNANLGDHYRNRLTHTMEVSQIARSISKNLGLNDELTEAIAIGHDLGHTPFGHIGEKTLHLLISGHYKTPDKIYNENNFGGFKHNYQSIQIIDNIEKRAQDYSGLNLTLAVREGILKHTNRKLALPTGTVDINYSSINLEDISLDTPSFTLEGQTVTIADEIAQCTHDLEDGLRAGIINKESLRDNAFIDEVCEKREIRLSELRETVDIRNTLIKVMVGTLIEDVCRNTREQIKEYMKKNSIPQFENKEDAFNVKIVSFSKEIQDLHKKLKKFITDIVIASQQITQSDKKAEHIIKRLFEGYFNSPQQLPDYILNRYYSKKGKAFNRIDIIGQIDTLKEDSEFIRLICDHISSMTDQYAAREYRKLYEPEYY